MSCLLLTLDWKIFKILTIVSVGEDISYVGLSGPASGSGSWYDLIGVKALI